MPQTSKNINHELQLISKIIRNKLMVTIYQLLDSLIDELDEGVPVPLSNQVIINPHNIKKIINQLSVEYSQNHNNQQSQQIIEHARIKAQEIIDNAKLQAQQIEQSAHHKLKKELDNSKVLQAINIEAHNIRNKVKLDTQNSYKLTQEKINTAEQEAQQVIQTIIHQAEQDACTIKEESLQYANTILQEMETLTAQSIEIIALQKERLHNFLNTPQAEEIIKQEEINQSSNAHTATLSRSSQPLEQAQEQPVHTTQIINYRKMQTS